MAGFAISPCHIWLTLLLYIIALQDTVLFVVWITCRLIIKIIYGIQASTEIFRFRAPVLKVGLFLFTFKADLTSIDLPALFANH